MTDPGPYVHDPEPLDVIPEPLPDDPPARPDVESSLFAAGDTAPARFDPVPVVSINAVDLYPGPVDPDGGPVVVDGLSINWGRSDVLEQPDPATGTVQLLDYTNRWARDVDRRGLPVTLRWEGTDVNGTAWSVVFFRGRIGAPITVTRRTVQHPTTGATVRASVITLPLVSVLLDLANTIPAVAFPDETVEDRAARLAALTAATGAVTSIVVDPYWKPQFMAAVAAADQVSLLDSLRLLYDSQGGSTYTYLPDSRTVEYVFRKLWGTATRGTALLNWFIAAGGSPRYLQGPYVLPYVFIQSDPAKAQGLQSYLDGAQAEYDPADGVTQPRRISRTAVTYTPRNAANTAYESTTTGRVVPGVTETSTGVLTATLSTAQTSPAWAGAALDRLESVVANEGSQWAVEPVRFVTRRTGFEHVGQARILLRGAEADDVLFLQRTWLPELGIRPIYGVQGGTIAYRGGAWDLDVDLAPIATRAKIHPITWEEIDNGTADFEVQWWDEPHPHALHESVTYADLGFVSTGLGVATAAMGPDTGWDAYS